jgi:LysR family cys regulon transcriptional activator
VKLQQLRYIVEISKNDLNVSNTAESLFTSQPGISKQVRLLEQELGVTIFTRHGKHLTKITPAGRQIIAMAAEILNQTQQIRQVAQEYRDNKVGNFTIGATHNQARYVLPRVLKEFMGRYPGISLHVHQGTPTQIAEEASRGMVDVAIATESLDQFENLVVLPSYEWSRYLLVPKGHALAEKAALSLEDVADYPIVTYVAGFGGRSQMDQAFERERLHPRVALTAVDADVIKTYVRLGLGVGVIATMAYDTLADADLVAIDARHLFGTSVTKIGMRRDLFMRDFMYDFIELFSPTLTKAKVQQAMSHVVLLEDVPVEEDE